jgi:hypothetical protein
MTLLFVFWHMEPANWKGCWGQMETATLNGIIEDPKGGVVPEAEVTATRMSSCD